MNGPQVSEVEQLAKDMRKAGAPEHLIDEVVGDIEDQTPVLLESNVIAFKWFIDVSSLLITSGLDLPAVHADTQMSHRQYDVNDYQKLKHIGIEAAFALNKSRKS